MTKEFYKILEIDKNATQEEIKKAYRKLAQKWHPDRQGGKSLEEKENANKKMREINRAYEILGNEELRKRYDLGETNFTSNFAAAECEAEMEDIKEKIRRKQEEINIMKDMLANEEERERIMEEMWLLNAEFIDRDGTYIEISAAMGFNFPRVYAEDLKAEGYSHLWEPYNDWLDKVWKMPITLKRKEKEKSDELKSFKEEMFKAIKEVGVILETKEKNKQETRANTKIEEERNRAIEAVESLLAEKGLKPSDLEENYKEVINNLDKVWKIRSARDRIKENISKLGSKEGERFVPKYEDKQDKQDKQDIEIDKLKEIINQLSSTKNNEEWNKEKEALLKQIQNLKSQNNQEEMNREINNLKQLVQQLEQEVQELRTEIQELKKENDNNSSEFRTYLAKKESELQSKQSKLEQLRSIVKFDNDELKPKSELDAKNSLLA